MGPVVVKLGGSFAFSELLRDWVEALASCAGRIVLVPGGGPFANAVRVAQPHMGFDDRAAHHMSLLAMEQYGRALASLNDRLVPADSIDLIKQQLLAGRVPVWMPAAMVSGAADIPPSWAVTSDSLAAWLSGIIGADQLILVKRSQFSGAEKCEDLVAEGVIDQAFPRYLRKAAIPASILGPSEHAALVAAIRCGRAVGFQLK
jgi:5-(aminomethyl)-3-furanmethanol phosphate kinase